MVIMPLAHNLGVPIAISSSMSQT